MAGQKKKELDPLDMAIGINFDFHVFRLSDGRSAQLISYDSSSGLYIKSDLPIELEVQARLMVEGYPTSEGLILAVVKASARNAPLIKPEVLNDPAREIVVFKNGALDLKSGNLRSHSPEYLYTIGIPYRFYPDAVCPRFDRFVQEMYMLLAALRVLR